MAQQATDVVGPLTPSRYDNCSNTEKENTRAKRIIQAVKRTVRPTKEALNSIIHALNFVKSQLLSNMMKKKL